ncbi:MAG: hypothetical protein OXI60_05150 [Acidiferrobacterales bacterium]|nr:hypothetical protein [Acidiferrobacterales bacterium]
MREIVEYLGKNDDTQHIILDLSGGNQSILDFFARFNSLYLVANARKSLSFSRINNTGPTDPNHKKYSDIFRAVLPSHVYSDVNVILVWDYFNYMERFEIINLMHFLSPHCREGAKLFAISWLTESIPSLPGDFGLHVEGDQIVYESSTDEVISSPEYSAQSLVDLMPSFIPYKLSVNISGMLEVLLEFNQLETSPSPYVIPSAKLSSFNPNNMV